MPLPMDDNKRNLPDVTPAAVDLMLLGIVMGRVVFVHVSGAPLDPKNGPRWPHGAFASNHTLLPRCFRLPQGRGIGGSPSSPSLSPS